MKRRVRKIANFFAFNLLFFALYLNFIHKDKVSIPSVQTSGIQAQAPSTAAFSGTVLVDNPEKYLDKKKESAAAANVENNTPVSTEGSVALKLSIN